MSGVESLAVFCPHSEQAEMLCETERLQDECLMLTSTSRHLARQLSRIKRIFYLSDLLIQLLIFLPLLRCIEMTMAAADRFFEKVLNDVLTATEQFSEKLEEGLSTIWKGTQNSDANTGGNKYDVSHDGHDNNDPMWEHEFDDAGDDDDAWTRESPLQGIADSVVGDIMGKQAGPQTPWENWNAFKSAITWTEPFIIALLVFQLFMLIITVAVSRNGRPLGPRIVVMVLIGGIVKSSEYMNGIAAQRWQSFSTQNYFDKRGVFMSIFVCAPLLLDSMIMLLLFLREAQQLLVQVKTKQLKRKTNKQAKSQAAANDNQNSTQKKEQ